MRLKLVVAALLTCGTLPILAQVAPAVKVGGLPLGVGGGFSDYDTDYYRPDLPFWSGRMTGASAWADYNIFHGLGVEAEGTYLFGNKPTPFLPPSEIRGSLSEKTIQGGLIYKYHPVFKLRPFAKILGGEGKVDFPSTNPFYTSENSGLISAGGGIEYRLWRTVFVRGEYEYQWWKDFRSNSQSLNPSGFTIGATYYLRGVHRHN
jgi:hypothetical protein